MSTTPIMPLTHIKSYSFADEEEKRTDASYSALDYVQISVVGARGGVNQDAVLAQPPGFFAVADGVGGGSFGEIASTMTLRHCAEAKDISITALAAWVQEADAVVARSIAELAENRGGATLVALWLQGWRARLLHVGDARAFLFRRSWRGRWYLAWQTVDQSYANNNISPPPGGSPDDPYQMIGTGAVGEPGSREFCMREEDLLLLCSDGLHRFVETPSISRLIDGGARAGLPLAVLARLLVGQAQQNGGYDDITILLLRRKPPRWRLWTLLAVAALLAVSWAIQHFFHLTLDYSFFARWGIA